MRLTPLDIKKQDFKRTMRGVDPDEVQAFLQMVADQWQELSEENNRLDRRINELESKLAHYKQVEEAMQEALKTARHSSKQALDAAKNKAKAIVDEAVATASRIQKKVEDEKYDLRRDIDRIQARRVEVIARLRALLTSELAILNDHERQHPDPNVYRVEQELDETLSEAEAPKDQVTFEEHKSVDEIQKLEESVEAEESEATSDHEADFEPVEADAHEDTLRFDASRESGVPQNEKTVIPAQAPQEDAPAQPPRSAPARQNDFRRDSPEMDKIRKILDDLA